MSLPGCPWSISHSGELTLNLPPRQCCPHLVKGTHPSRCSGQSPASLPGFFLSFLTLKYTPSVNSVGGIPCKDPGLIPDWGTKILQAAKCGQKKKTKQATKKHPQIPNPAGSTLKIYRESNHDLPLSSSPFRTLIQSHHRLSPSEISQWPLIWSACFYL